VFNVNCEIDHHDKFYLPANIQQNRTTGVGVMAPEMNDFDLMETFFFLELLILKKEGRLHFPLSAIVFEILISQQLQFDPYVDLCTQNGEMISISPLRCRNLECLLFRLCVFAFTISRFNFVFQNPKAKSNIL
jgi:hypothetical protein